MSNKQSSTSTSIVSPYDHEAMNKLTSDERLKACLEYMRQQFVVEYAYPSSETAKKYGMAISGVWYVSRNTGGLNREPIMSEGYRYREQAERTAEMLRVREEIR